MKYPFLILILSSTFATALLAQTTISYQGKLESSGQPFDGTVEMIFELHELETGDSEIATHGPVTVEVSDGLFQADLAFGSGAFDGDPRYLEIIIDGMSLAERQPIRPSPMTLFASDGDGGGGNGGESIWDQVGDDAVYEQGNVGIGTTNPQEALDVAGGLRVMSDVHGTSNIVTDGELHVNADASSNLSYIRFRDSSDQDGPRVYHRESDDQIHFAGIDRTRIFDDFQVSGNIVGNLRMNDRLIVNANQSTEGAWICFREDDCTGPRMFHTIETDRINVSVFTQFDGGFFTLFDGCCPA